VSDDLVLTPGADAVRPVMICAYEGYFDVAQASTMAARSLLRIGSTTIATIDHERYYDFTAQRPHARRGDDGERVIQWPEHRLERVRVEEAPRDLVVLVAAEPHLAWARYATAIVAAAQAFGAELVVTLGAVPDRVPHTRVPQVFGSTTTPGLAAALGLSRPQYQGLTGVVGVLHDRLDAAGIPAIALRTSVPHYVMNAPHPLAVAALVSHLQHVTGVPLSSLSFEDEIREWRVRHDEAVAENPEVAHYVSVLEADYDRRLERSIPTGDSLADELEKFLRDQRDT
jgi:PAC2 family